MSTKHLFPILASTVLLGSAVYFGCGGDSGTATVTGDDAGATDDGGDEGAAKAVCGNGVLEPPEECDDGNTTNGDGCENDCTFTCIAGDPKRDHCDDHNPCNGTETCTAMHTCKPGTPIADGMMCGTGKVCTGGNCMAGSCGDKIVEPPEECDDGNAVNGDGCDNNCKFSCVSTDTTRNCTSANACINNGTCNDTMHVCTAGANKANGTTCGSMMVCTNGMCGAGMCGNGITEPGEDCDFGAGNNTTGSGCEPTCKFSCTTNPNSCDDHNPCNGVESCNSVMVSGHMGQKCAAGTPLTNGTSCGTNATCQNGNCVGALCGNGVIDSGEQCDLGTAVNGTHQGCSASCQLDCQAATDCSAQATCNGTTCVAATVQGQMVKKCQTGTNAAKCTTCTGGLCNGSGTCAASTCGDGCIDASRGETCDPPSSTCDASCHLLPVCGNGVIEGTEQCDDGNLRNLDGCDKTCKYEVVGRMTSIAIQGTAAPAGCTPTTNRLGTQSLTNTALGNINSSLTTGINDGSTDVMTYFMGLDDLTGVADPNGLTIGVLSASLDPAKGTWPTNPANPIDWWFFAAGSTVSMGSPTGILTNGTLAARALAAGPSDVSLTLLLGGSPALLEMRSARIAATLNGTPPPNVPAPPPAQLASGLTVFQTFTGSGTNQGLCGNITVESLAQIPIPQVLTTGLTACQAGCSGSHSYTYCGMGMPVGPNCNSLLDALVGGCKAAFCINAINAYQPDVPGNGTATLTLGANNKVPAAQTTGNTNAYSSYMKLDGNRAHFTSQTCAQPSDCQSGLTCQTGVCR